MNLEAPQNHDGARLSTFIERVVPLLRAISTDQHLSPSAASLMSLLEIGGKARITELARLQAVSQPGMTQLVNRLAAEGLVSRIEDHRARATWVEIAPAGRLALEQRRSRRAHALTTMLSRLEPSERESVTRALAPLERLVDAWEPPAEIPPTEHLTEQAGSP